MSRNTHEHDTEKKGMTPDEMLAKLFHDEDDHSGPKVVGIGPISGNDLMSFFESLGVKLPGMDPDSDDTETATGEKTNADANDDPRKHFNSSITVRFDATGNTPKFSLGLDIHGSAQFAEIAMIEALAAFVEHNTPGINTKSLIEDLLVNIALIRAMDKLGPQDEKMPGSGLLN